MALIVPWRFMVAIRPSVSSFDWRAYGYLVSSAMGLVTGFLFGLAIGHFCGGHKTRWGGGIGGLLGGALSGQAAWGLANTGDGPLAIVPNLVLALLVASVFSIALSTYMREDDESAEP